MTCHTINYGSLGIVTNSTWLLDKMINIERVYKRNEKAKPS